MRPFGCLVTILNTIDHLGKFDGKADEGFFVGYSLNSKAFRVFNSRTRIVEENLHIRFSESTPNVVGSGPDWLFDIDALTRTMNYEPIVAGTQSNGFAGTKASDNAGQARKETEPKVDEDSRKDSEGIDQEKEDNVNSTNNVNAASTNEVNVVGGKTSIELPLDPNMPELEDYNIFDSSRNDEDDGAEDDMNNLDTTIQRRAFWTASTPMETFKSRAVLVFRLLKGWKMVIDNKKWVFIMFREVNYWFQLLLSRHFQETWNIMLYKCNIICCACARTKSIQDSSFDLVDYTYSDYAGAQAIDRKSTTEEIQEETHKSEDECNESEITRCYKSIRVSIDAEDTEKTVSQMVDVSAVQRLQLCEIVEEIIS
ncbi:retrovirus-related pol polyprotein from transposon TNT 1-94 [Tanacetum coccineum]|uniref:Retrovirus-related pol polyprotein from transposon TNT 1-94 n=1 Tax=Tanacetum coccineum TaxID=301880 RepID=A0ABQ4YCP3_9ASTR